MKKIHILAAIIVATLAPLAAQATEDPIALLARQSGLSERQVRMVIANGTAYGEYRTYYVRAKQQLVKAIGESNYQRLVDGRSFQLELQPAPQVAAQEHPY